MNKYKYERDCTLKEHHGNYFRVWTEPELFDIDFESVKKHSDGRITAVITFKLFNWDINETNKHLFPYIIRTNINLSSMRSQAEIATKLATRYTLVDKNTYEQILEDAANLVIYNLDKGEPFQVIDGAEATDLKVEYLIEPLVVKRLPNIIFGDGGSGKSIIGLGFCILCSTPDFNPLAMTIQQAKSLYLDYEFDFEDTRSRSRKITNGWGIDPVKISYRRCFLPLVNEVNKIQEYVLKHDISFLVVDSLASAAGSDNLKEANAATDFYMALAQLKCTSLIIAHPSKGNGEYHSARSIYGSTFFRNFARNIWVAQSQQTEGEDEISLALTHDKTNLTKKQPPVGFKIKFSDDSINIERQDIADVPSFSSIMPVKQRIRDYLSGNGMKSEQEIAEYLDEPQNKIHVRLYEMKKHDEVIYLEKKWGLSAVKYDD